mmetsp:Transcript_37451/g.58525  ORF Transcript_37451/g.58525 Transcript_37451/m.58525 type:complete len:177 (+) Transcript_37451:30-560(+)
MPPSRRTGAARPVVKQAPPPAKPSIPQATQARPGAAPPAPAPAGAPGPAPAAPWGGAAPQAPPPAMAPAAAPPAAAGGGGGVLSGIAGTVVQGMAFGTGSAVANRAVDAVMGPRTVEHVHSNQPAAPQQAAAPAGGACGNEMKMFQDCVTNSGGDVSACQAYMDMLNTCRTQFPSA